MNTVNTIIRLLFLLLGLGVCIFLLIQVTQGLKTVDDYNQLKSSVSAGEIVGKKTKNGYTGIFKGYIPVRYFFEVEWKYEKDGEVTVESKDFEVEQDVYLAYDIGDYYDSQNFRFVSETENTEVEERDQKASTE